MNQMRFLRAKCPQMPSNTFQYKTQNTAAFHSCGKKKVSQEVSQLHRNLINTKLKPVFSQMIEFRSYFRGNDKNTMPVVSQ